jgi:hypothetical protein
MRWSAWKNGNPRRTTEEIRAIIEQDLRPLLRSFDVDIAPVILSEASVSAVVRSSGAIPSVDGVNAAFSKF